VGESVRLCLISNGTLLNAQVAEQVARTFDEVRISVDGPAEVNDALRGAGTYQGALRAIRHLGNAGLYAAVSIVASAANLPHLPAFLGFLLDEMSVTEFHVAPFRPVGRGAGRPELACSWREAQLAVAEFWRSRFGAPSHLRDEAAYPLATCGRCGIGGYLNVLPDGSVYPCHVLSAPAFYLGNLRQESLAAIVGGSELLERLAGLDLTSPAGASARLRHLREQAVCLGEVYRDAPEEFSRWCSCTANHRFFRGPR